MSFLGAFAEGIRPDPQFTISEWADEYRVLSARSSPEPGRWRTERTPYLRGIMDALSPDSPAERVVFMAGSQIGKSETGCNWVGYVIHIAPGPMLCVQPTVDMAKRMSKQRIAPLIEDCPELSERIARPNSHGGSNNLLAKEFPGGVLVLTGANSPTGLRSMPVRYLFLDEVDGYPGDVGGEGDPCDLAITRTRNFPRRKILITSTPVISGRSRIEHFYEQSDQCYYHVPCPRCDTFQVLRFEALRWPKGRPDLAVYPCEACGYEMRDADKNLMLERGAWRPSASGDGRTRGFHLSSLYSPTGWLAWGKVAAQYDAATDPEKLQVFWNTVLGRAWVELGETPDHERLYERREHYPIGIVPAGGLVLTAGVDVQLKRIEVEIVAWGRRKESWSIDFRTFDGDTAQPEVWRKVGDLLDEDFPSELGGSMRIAKMGVDSGFNTSAVYDFIRTVQPARAMCIKGDSRTAGLVGSASMIEVTPQGKRVRYGIRLWPVNSSIAKEELYRWLRASMPDLEAGEPWPVGYCHFPQYGMEYFEQLTAEHLITRTIQGRRKSVWEKLRDRNEALDCRLYARAAAAALRIDTWTEKKWAELEAALVSEEVKAPPALRPMQPAAKVAVKRTAVPQFQSMGGSQSFLE